MASSSSLMLGLKLSCFVILVFVMTLPLVTEGITCGGVVSFLSPCVNYLQKGGPIPPACCPGVKRLNSQASNSAARQQVCNCLKSIAASFKINYGIASGLPGKCGVSVPYKIDPSTDCSKVK